MGKIQSLSKIIILIIFISGALFIVNFSLAEYSLAQKLSGRILLQVQSRGEAWYIHPADQKKYYLGRPQDAFELMRKLGLGVKHEVIVNKNYSKLLGEILIDTEDNGKAYYINPLDKKSYYLGRPNDAFQIMKTLGMGITNINLDKILSGYLPYTNNNNTTYNNAAGIISKAAEAIRSGDTNSAVQYFIPEMKDIVKYTMNYLKNDGKLILGNIMSGAKLTSSVENEKIYTDEIYFNGQKIKVDFHIKKQLDGTWLMANL